MKRADFWMLATLIVLSPHWPPLFSAGYGLLAFVAWLYFSWKGR